MKIFSKEYGEFINVHPTFLYESIADFIIFVILMSLRKRKKFSGQIVYLYFILYGLVRFFIEELRTDSLMIGTIKISKLLSAIFVIISITMYIIDDKCRRKKASKD